LWSSLFAWIENAKYSKILKEAADPEDPIFIIGHWRTGTTFMHQLLALDPNLSVPTLFEVAVPDSFLVSYSWYRPIFKRLVSEHRPMDQVKLGMDEPQEDEYAIYRITSFSPLENLVFPKSQDYFLNHGSQFTPSAEQLSNWKKTVKDFYKKLFFKKAKRIVLKNPFNSFRISTLYEMYPKARFIYLVRHPYSVVPSTIHMWNTLQHQNSMNNDHRPPHVKEVVAILKNLTHAVELDRAKLPPGTIVQVRFEDLEAEPTEVLKNVYKELGILFTENFELLIKGFMQENAAYRKNEFSLTTEEKLFISRELDFTMKSLCYDQDC
jgi:hypothetical protein